MAPVRWAGLEHWSRLFTDEHFSLVLLTTLLYFVIGIPVQFFIGLALARALDRQRRAAELAADPFPHPDDAEPGGRRLRRRAA